MSKEIEEKLLVQCRIPEALHQIIKIRAKEEGRSIASWVRQAVLQNIEHMRPKLTIVSLDGADHDCRELFFEVTKRAVDDTPIEGYVIGDDRSLQGWNEDLKRHFFLIGKSHQLREVEWTMYDETRKSLLVRLKTVI